MEIAKLVLQAVAVFAALAGLGYTILSAWKKAQEKKLQITLQAMQRQVDETVAMTKKEVDEERQHRIENVNRLHARIDKVQTDLISDLQGRMSRMEGELKGMTNILTQIQGWFIDQANKSKG
jgi:hypothetical protein